MRATHTHADAIRLVLDTAATSPHDTVWIGVDGRAGAGKTTFAARLAAAGTRIAVVHIDDFAGPHIAEWDRLRFRDQVVAPLRAGADARYQRWDWDADQGAEWHRIAPGRVVVVEGVSATRREVEVPWALRIWVDAPRELRLARALDRDGAAAMPRWLEDWMPSEEAYIAREHPERRADVVLSGTEQAGG